MFKSEPGTIIRIFIGESDKHEGMPLYEWIVRRAKLKGLAGSTVVRGIQGFGAQSKIHSAKILALSSDLPIVVELVDSEEKIEAFMPELEGALKEGLVIKDTVEIAFYQASGEN